MGPSPLSWRVVDTLIGRVRDFRTARVKIPPAVLPLVEDSRSERRQPMYGGACALSRASADRSAPAWVSLTVPDSFIWRLAAARAVPDDVVTREILARRFQCAFS